MQNLNGIAKIGKVGAGKTVIVLFKKTKEEGKYFCLFFYK